MPTVSYERASLPAIGKVWIAAGPRGVLRIAIGGTETSFLRHLPLGAVRKEGDALLRKIAKKLSAWAEGRRASFDFPLDLREGTPFQQRVWRAIATIPWGEARSYAWLARAAGKPRACRAVAQACGANPVPIIIPCHRVIASDGTLGGFSGGLELKRKLLRLEGRIQAGSGRNPVSMRAGSRLSPG